MKAKSENPAEYKVRIVGDDALIAEALRIIESRLKLASISMSSPSDALDYLKINLAPLQHEEFWCLWLDGQNRLIAAESIFRGTLTQTSVYPREVVKSALAHNAGAVILAHNHPSGMCEPSRADEVLTSSLKSALAMVDCKVLDHIIVAGVSALSFAERGLI